MEKPKCESMKLENLEVGMVLKNYPHLCKLLEIDVKGGEAKNKQMKWLEKHFSYEKEGYSFIITKILKDKVQPTEDRRGTNPNSHNNQNGAYGKYIRLLILNMLSQNKDNMILSGKNLILENLNMINHNYRYGSYNRKKLANYLGMDIKFIHEFYDTNTRKLKDSVKTTLNRLMNNEKLIFWNNVKMIGKNGAHREATNEEVKFIINCEKGVLKDMGTNTMKYIYASDKLDEFYIRVKRKWKEGDNIDFAYNAYKIIFADAVYEQNKQLEYKLGTEELNEHKSELNATVFNNLGKSIVNRRNITVDDLTDIQKISPPEQVFPDSKYKQVLLDEDYVSESKRLLNISIIDSYENICERIGIAWQISKNELTEQEMRNMMK